MHCSTRPSRRSFLHQCVGTLTAVTVGGAADAASTDVPAARLARLATGANVAKWFRFPRALTDEHFSGYLGEEEVAMLARCGLRHVRLCVHPSVLMDPADGRVLAARAAQLRSAIQRFHRHGLLVVLDMHNEARRDELNPDWQAAFESFWAALARAVADFDPELLMFEVLNEPVFAGREQDWPPFNLRLIRAIRANAPEHTIVTSGAQWGGVRGLLAMEPLADRNVIYSFHFYDPFPFTHQGATWSSDAVKPLRRVPYPSSPEAVAPLLPALPDHPGSQALLRRYGSERWDRDKLAARFAEAVAWGKRHGVPLYCGEFGVFHRHSPAADRARWFRDFGTVLAANSIGWAVWGWDEGFGLNRSYKEGKPVIDTQVAAALGLRAP